MVIIFLLLFLLPAQIEPHFAVDPTFQESPKFRSGIYTFMPNANNTESTALITFDAALTVAEDRIKATVGINFIECKFNSYYSKFLFGFGGLFSSKIDSYSNLVLH